MMRYDYYDGPHGRMLLVSRGEDLCGAYFKWQKHFREPEREWHLEPDAAPLRQARRELAEYFGGRRTRFEVPLAAEGTPFQRAVWKAIAGVPFGETISYAELARRAGRPGSARAAGAATGRNPIGVIVPCHRIVGSDGSLTGYAGGLDRKRALLALEDGARSACHRQAA
ncbi:MAG TPA: methylated-DNA--[protein]-cysteine S-methyltransferase [Burkholderiales bacterium]|nr:methylated-DNA--[protein]-cysteine S-methyltransferase [Burkholderiales bacterium]